MVNSGCVLPTLECAAVGGRGDNARQLIRTVFGEPVVPAIIDEPGLALGFTGKRNNALVQVMRAVGRIPLPLSSKAASQIIGQCESTMP